MKVLFAAGGTGGHINPALAAAGMVRQRHPDAKILFIGTAEKMEARLVPAAGYDFQTIDISGFQRKLSLENIKRNLATISRLLKSSAQAKRILLDFQPDVVVGFGGYVSGPVLRMAAKLGFKTAIHEQNAFPGKTNKLLAGEVDKVMLAVPAAEQYLRAKNPCVVTGLPVRGELLRADRTLSRFELGLDDRPLVLSMGGSLGAEAVNRAMVEVIAGRHSQADCYFMHAMGQYGLWMRDALREKGVDTAAEQHVIIREYIDDMHRCMAAADVVICRSGASSLSEIEAMGKASILIPSPNVAENHQYHNAMALVSEDAAVLIEEKELTGERLARELGALLGDPARRGRIGENAKRLAITDANERIYNVIVGLAGETPRG